MGVLSRSLTTRSLTVRGPTSKGLTSRGVTFSDLTTRILTSWGLTIRFLTTSGLTAHCFSHSGVFTFLREKDRRGGVHMSFFLVRTVFTTLRAVVSLVHGFPVA